MALLILGLAVFALVHLVPSLAPGLKSRWHGKFGEGGYKGSFSGLLLLSLVLIVMGWRSIAPTMVYLPPTALKFPALFLLCLGFFLFVVSNRPSRLRNLIRHPQLSGLVLWALAHLLLNGDNRSLVLFGALGLWAIVEILAINKREGVWVKEATPAVTVECVSLLITAIVVVVVVAIHPYISGMPVH